MKLSPDYPSAEPALDLLAQLKDMIDGVPWRLAVFLSHDCYQQLERKAPHALDQILDSGVPCSVSTGHLICKDFQTLDAVEAAIADGMPLQTVIGRLIGAGDGKPDDGEYIVQQRTDDGAVTRESVVTADELDGRCEQFFEWDRHVVVLTPAEALLRRHQLINLENAGSDQAVKVLQ